MLKQFLSPEWDEIYFIKNKKFKFFIPDANLTSIIEKQIFHDLFY